MALLGLNSVLNMMASTLSAESIRMNVLASNLANANSVGSSDKDTFHAKHPVFSEVNQKIMGLPEGEQPQGGVRVVDIIQSKKPLEWRYEPDNPLADEQGKIYITDVNPIEEMTNMIASSKQYQAGIEVMNTTKNLLMQTIHALDKY